MMSLINSDRFRAEYKQFQTQIESITDESAKKELIDLLGKLVNEVRKLDTMHQELNMRPRLPSGSADSKSSIQELRKQIQTKLKVYYA